MGFGFRIAPGVRVYPASRGLGVGMYSGPVGYYTRVGGGGRRSSGGSVAAHQRQVRAAQRQQEIEAVIALDREIVRLASVHEQEFPVAQPAAAPTATAVDENAVRKDLEKNELQGVPLLKFSERKAAKQKAREQLTAQVEAERARAEEERADRQRELDAAWHKLLANDEGTVLASLEEAFADNEAPAVAVSCKGDRVDLIMRWPGLDEVVSDRKSGLTPTGRPTHRKRSKTERNELYLEAMGSNALATVKEAFAVAPGLQEAALLVFREVDDEAFGDRVLEPLFAGVISRQMLEQLHWSRINPAATLQAVPDSTIGLKGKSKELKAVDVSDDPDAVAVIGQLAASLGVRSPYGTPDLAPVPDAPIHETMSVDAEVTRLDGLRPAVLQALGTLAQRSGAEAVAADDHLLLLAQHEGSRGVIALTYETEGDERLAEILETFETYSPLAAAHACPTGQAAEMAVFMRDWYGDESLETVSLADGEPRVLVGTPAEPAEAALCREGLTRSRAKWGGR